MRIAILGATGNSGRRLVAGALADGHTVTAIVRRAGDLPERYPGIVIREVDYADRAALTDAIEGQDVAVNVAGHVRDPETFSHLITDVVAATEAALGPDGRFWMFAGVALLDVPGTTKKTVDLPRVPEFYHVHVRNYNTVRASVLDWSILCPGPMIDAPDGLARDDLVISTESWPVARPEITRALPWIATSAAFRQAMGRLTITYEDAARVVLDNLAPGPLSRCRVGVALPEGESLSKKGYS